MADFLPWWWPATIHSSDDQDLGYGVLTSETYMAALVVIPGYGKWAKCINDIISCSVYMVQTTLALALAIFPPFGTFGEEGV